MTHFFSRRDSGMTLTETLIAVGIFGFVAMAAANVLVNYGRTNAKVEDIGEIYDLRQYVRNSMSCEDTFSDQSASDSCRSPGGGAIDIRDRSGNVIVSKIEGATTLFDYKLRGHCIENSGINEILIEYLPVNAGGAVRQDSLSRKTATWKSLTDKIPLVCSKTCGGFSTSSGCFYAIGQHTSVPIDIGLPSVPVSCDNFCSTRGGSDPVGLSCAQCASLFKELYTGPDFQCVDVNPTNYAIDVEYWKTVSPNAPPGFHAAYAASCSVLWMHNGKGGVQSLKFAPNQPHYDLKFGRIYSGGAVHWASYICNCKK